MTSGRFDNAFVPLYYHPEVPKPDPPPLEELELELELDELLLLEARLELLELLDDPKLELLQLEEDEDREPNDERPKVIPESLSQRRRRDSASRASLRFFLATCRFAAAIAFFDIVEAARLN